MQYISTRGLTEPIGFQRSVMTGLARDGGLLLPQSIPTAAASLAGWAALSYTELAFEIMRLYVDLPDAKLKALIDRSYAAFRHPDVAPVVPVGDVFVLELFHGPTLAFKDIALQFLGNLFSDILEQTGEKLNIVAATSGDTGSAAIHGVRGRPRIHIFVMHPHRRVSPLQERQMTSVLDPNVFNIAVNGSFDDCQGIMKRLFSDLPFKDRYALGAVNSVNWARVLSQIVYYFYAAFRVMEKTGAGQVQFAVPTGNFGDILAGYIAWRMGLPISRLILATNENDILSRFFNTGVYSLGQVVPTLSPSMDIQVASNFERYLYYRLHEDAAALRETMELFGATGSLSVPLNENGRVDDLIAAGAVNTAQTLDVIRRYHAEHGYLLDPHTAVGVFVGERHLSSSSPTICLATAHPAKFGQAIRDATGQDLGHHEILDRLLDAPTRCEVLPADEQAIRDFVSNRAL
ncbi:MAG TPA: threonine synthase [Verrucomicrobia bacterium]|nr:MAG: threonine synthase [Lentisphaerae bacterium GWF2_57_35]HBA82964.1 threonine synthase [Verrucomicrobiota bacterium]